jgi:hypothetical protein
MTLNALLAQVPDSKDAMDFLQKGGAFALLCVVVIAGGVGLAFAGRALFKLLREFLTKLLAQLETQTQTLSELASDTKGLREGQEATAASVNPWGSPEWLKARLDQLERRADEIKSAIHEVRLDLAKVGSGESS